MKLKILTSIAACVIGLVLAGVYIGPTTLKRWAYEEPGRDRWQQPERVVEALNIESGQTIADVGSGGGYFTFRLAEAVGAGGTVYACDVDKGLNAYVRDEARRRGHANIKVVQAAFDDPRIPGTGVDLLFSCNTVHHFEDFVGYFNNVRKYLRPGGRVAIVDYFDKHGSAPPEALQQRMEEAGYRLLERPDFLTKQYFMVFTPAERAS